MRLASEDIEIPRLNGVSGARTSGDTPRRAAQHADGQQNDRRKQPEDAADGNSHDPKWQQDHPHDRVEHERQQGDRPAEKQEQQPDQESNHPLFVRELPAEGSR